LFFLSRSNFFSDNVYSCGSVRLKAIHRFSSTADAVEDLTAVADGKLSKGLKKFLVDEIQSKAKAGKEEALVVADAKLGQFAPVSFDLYLLLFS
jgi:hypothetical protein